MVFPIAPDSALARAGGNPGPDKFTFDRVDTGLVGHDHRHVHLALVAGLQRSLLLGAPPKFIWLRLGNCSVAESAALLRRHSVSIHTFDADETQSHLMLP